MDNMEGFRGKANQRQQEVLTWRGGVGTFLLRVWVSLYGDDVDEHSGKMGERGEGVGYGMDAPGTP